MGDSCVLFVLACISERKESEPPSSENSWSNLWLPCVYPFSSFSTPPLPISPRISAICNPPYLGPHSGTQCFPDTSICLRLISHVVCVSQRSAHTHTKLSVMHPRFAVPRRDTQKKLDVSNLKQNQLRRAHQTGSHVGLRWEAWLRVGERLSTSGQAKSPQSNYKSEQYDGYKCGPASF